MQLWAAAKLTSMRFEGDGLEQEQEKLEPKEPESSGPKMRGNFGRLTPVHEATHKKLTQGGYKHLANYETQNGQGRFGYYENPASGHKVIVDDRGGVQDQSHMQQQGGGKKFGGGNRGMNFGGKYQVRRGKKIPKSKFAWAPGNDPSKWKLPIDTPGRIRNAPARINQTQGIPGNKKAGVLNKVRRAEKHVGVDVPEEPTKKQKSWAKHKIKAGGPGK
jgi:hypothetical protein